VEVLWLEWRLALTRLVDHVVISRHEAEILHNGRMMWGKELYCCKVQEQCINYRSVAY